MQMKRSPLSLFAKNERFKQSANDKNIQEGNFYKSLFSYKCYS